MRLLLDTHIYLWYLQDDKKLSIASRQLIAEAEVVYVSVLSVWEIGIKIQKGKYDADMDLLVNAIEPSGFTPLPLTFQPLANLTQLPLYHHDPFDRMLIAQAIHEPLHFLTADASLKKYSELVVIN